MSDVLVVIDLQVGVLASCDDAEKVLTNVAFLLAKARGAGVPVVFIQHESPTLVRDTADWQIPDSIAPLAGEPRVFKRYRDSFADTDLAETLAAVAVQTILSPLRKDFLQGLAETLADLGIETAQIAPASSAVDGTAVPTAPDTRQRLVIVGAKSNNCVITTAMSALARGYDILFVTDAHTTSPLDLPSGTITGVQIAEVVNQYFTLASPTAAYPNVNCTTTTTANLTYDK